MVQCMYTVQCGTVNAKSLRRSNPKSRFHQDNAEITEKYSVTKSIHSKSIFHRFLSLGISKIILPAVCDPTAKTVKCKIMKLDYFSKYIN